MRIQVQALFDGKVAEAFVPYEKGTKQRLPNEYPFNQNIYLSGDDGIFLGTVSISEEGEVEYCRNTFKVTGEGSILSPFRDERIIFNFKLVDDIK